MLVLAVAGDFCSPHQLTGLQESLNKYQPSLEKNNINAWKRWLASWESKGWLTIGTNHRSRYFQLRHELNHAILAGTSESVLEGYLHAIETDYWLHVQPARQARLALYLGEAYLFADLMERSRDEDWIELFGPTPLPAALALIPQDTRAFYLGILGNQSMSMEAPVSQVVLDSTEDAIAPYRVALFALRGEIPAAEKQLKGVDPAKDVSGNLYAAMAILDLAKDDPESARANATLSLDISKGKKKYPSVAGTLGTWAAFCALTGTPKQRGFAELLLSNPKRLTLCSPVDSILVTFLVWLHGDSDKPLGIHHAPAQRNLLALVFHCIMVRWNTIEDCAEDRSDIANGLKAMGWHWLRAEFLSLKAPTQAGTLATLFEAKPAWQRKLDTLSVFASSLQNAKPPTKKQSSSAEHRITWLLSYDSKYEHASLSAQLQKRNKKGFSKGRSITAAQLQKKLEQPWVTVQDRQAIHAITAGPSYRGSGVHYMFGLPCILALVGHARVYWEDGMDPAEVVAEPPAVRVERKDKSILVTPIPMAFEIGLLATREHSRLLVYEVGKQHLELCRAMGDTLTLPAQAEEKLAQVLGQFPTNIPLHTDITPEGREAQTVPANSQLLVQLRRDSDVLRVSWFVVPLGDAGPLCKPGLGNAGLVAEVDGHALQTKRDLAEERAQEKALLAACPTLEGAEVRGDEYVLRGLGPTLSLLHELHTMGEAIACLWKEGEPMRVDMSADMSSLQLRFADTNAWLAADISVQVSKELSLKAHELVGKLVPGATQFVQLDDNQFVALSETLSAKLQELEGLGRVGKKGLTMGPANAYALSAWLGDLESKSAKKGAKLAAKRLAKVRESTSLVAPVPKTFKAELRDYQLDGYHWLARLAHWGGGALLCDDMGLGKTVQMLALLVERSAQGPALVVAPVSVGPHWANLMRQFAPTLRPRQLDSAGRKEAIASLGPRDVLVVSYGLLHSECDLLTERSYITIVLDEAQAIKNPRSQRARAAFKLQGEFRVITTGTPIENNLGELWSLMNFANPGLLGTSRQFADAYGKPIQKDGSREASAKLRKLLTPFLLRRTKAQVLTELPPKTEITLEVEPEEDEAQFYAGVRDSMLAELQAGLDRPVQQRIQILAALMKLRRIACHPSLGDPSVTCGSAKQRVFLELVDELRNAGHRILVFSQFVGHLTIAKANLDAKNISYQYLDGSTSKAKRKKAVEDFQNGAGDVFLISLKAGGVGLHLTGADYVIHLDPWWNPAVEDQASDRAHRMGQTRPVTVYRLVTKGTVEQRVLELHSRKRQLADDLISGNEKATSLDVGDLMALMADSKN